MATLKARLVAYEPGGDRIGPLTEPLSFSAAIIRNSVGSLTLSYSRKAAQGSYFAQSLDSGLEIALEVAKGPDGEWIEPHSCRFIALKANEDDAYDPSDIVQLTCPSYGILLSKARNLDTDKLETEGGDEGRRQFLQSSAGRIIGDLLGENAARSGVPVGSDTFTAVKDSFGKDWLNHYGITYDLGIQLSDVLDNLSAQGACDYTFNGRELLLANPDESLIHDRTLNQLWLRQGRDISVGPTELTLENMAHRVMVIGDQGLIFEKEAQGGPRPWGTWELSVQQGGVSVAQTAELLLQNQLAASSRMTSQYTRDLVTADVDNLPLLDYDVGDWIYAPTVTQRERVRVQQITISLDHDKGVSASLILNDKLLDDELRRAKRQAGIVNGSASGGNGSQPTEGNLKTMGQVPFTNVDRKTVTDGDDPVRIGDVQFTARAKTNVIVHLNFDFISESQPATDGDVTTYPLVQPIITYKLDNEDLYQTNPLLVSDGQDSRHLMLLLTAEKESTHRLEVFVASGSGTVTVPQIGFRGLVEGVGLIVDVQWDGTITIDDTYTPLVFGRPFTPVGMTGTVTAVTQIPLGAGLSAVIAPIQLGRSFSPVGFEGALTYPAYAQIHSDNLAECTVTGTVTAPDSMILAGSDATVTSLLYGRDVMTIGIGSTYFSNALGGVTALISLDGGATWVSWNGSAWVEDTVGMDKATFESLPTEAWDSFDPSDGIMFRAVMPKNSSLQSLGVNFTLVGEDES